MVSQLYLVGLGINVEIETLNKDIYCNFRLIDERYLKIIYLSNELVWFPSEKEDKICGVDFGQSW